jgi:hypothetical protein
MKAEVKIPRGWRRVRKGVSKSGDHFLQTTFIAGNLHWSPSDVGNEIRFDDIYIRRKAPQKKHPRRTQP